MTDYREHFRVDELTPVECYNGMWFKRDDLYKPFDNIPLSGGKVRQCICLIGNNEGEIRDDCDGHVVTGTSISSPQGIIVSRVAGEFGFDSKVFVGNTTKESLIKKPLMVNILKQGGRINYESRLAYDSVLNSTIHRKMDEGEKMFHIKFGINLDKDPESILGSVGAQVQNLPKDLDYLFIPCGSCIILSGVLWGLQRYGVHVEHVVGIQISGYDRTKDIERMLKSVGCEYPYEFEISKDYPYSTEVYHTIVPGFDLDKIYEAKAYDYVLRYYQNRIKDKCCCFWVVGNANPVRSKVF